MQIQVSRDQLVEDSVFILQCLRQNQRGGRQNGLAEVRSTLEGSVALDLAAYVAFLRRFGYVEVDLKAAALTVTAQGDRAATGAADVAPDVANHFAEVLVGGAQPAGESAFDALLRSAGIDDTQPEARSPQGAEVLHVTAPQLDPVQGELGQGPLSRVRAARYGELGSCVALKEWKPLWEALPWLSRAELSRRVRREAQGQAQLDHPCVLPLYDVRGGEDAHVVMPLAASTLREKLKQRARLPLAMAARIAAQAAHGLAHAHAQGLVHGALKPENVLLDRHGNVQLSDFGAARLVALPAAAQPGPRVVVELGHAAYRAPEVSASEAAGTQADAWALGALFHELLAGSPSAPLPEGTHSLARDLLAELHQETPEKRPALAAVAQRLLPLLDDRHPLFAL